MLTKNKESSIRNQISGTTNIVFNIMFIFNVLLCICPILLVFMVSITDESALSRYGFSFFPKQYSNKAYEYIFSNSGEILHAYGVTIFVTVVGTLISLFIVSLYAYPLSRKDFKYRNIFSFIVFFPMLFGGGLVPTFMIYSKLLHWTDTMTILIFPALLAPMHVIIMKTFFATSIPDSIVESAKIDGAGELRVFFSIVLRLSTPSLATIGLFTTLIYWNEWFVCLLYITNEKLVTLQFLLYRVQSNLEYLIQLSNQTGQGAMTLAELPGQSARMALCFVSIGPIILTFPFFQKYIVKGLTIGAVKG